MKEDDITLENQRVVYHFIKENPGVHLRRIARELDMHLGTLRYHINFLEKNGLLIGRPERNTRIYFVTGGLGSKDRKLTSLLQQKRCRDLILVLINGPGMTHSDVMAELSIKPSTLSKYLRILEDRGIIRHERDGREKRYYTVDEGRVIRMLMTYRKSFWDSFVDNALELYFE